ncbi:MAG: hypothetical protein IJB90_01380 [Clostridia bacterium]|nr:hypothetical protein [Clostridia bacterium]
MIKLIANVVGVDAHIDPKNKQINAGRCGHRPLQLKMNSFLQIIIYNFFLETFNFMIYNIFTLIKRSDVNESL